MDLVPLFSKVMVGAAEASLDVAGAALLPGAWPILKAAIEPIIDRLKERLGGDDITASRELAQQAVKQFEADPHLQEMLRSRLLTDLDELARGQQVIDKDVQRLMLIVSGNQDILRDLVGSVARVEQHMADGVNLSDEAVAKLVGAISRQAESSRQIRAIALSEMGPVAALVTRQVNRLQARAVELIDDKELDRATDELREGLLLVAALLNEAPTDVNLRMQLGMIYKTIAQVHQAAGKTEQSAAVVAQAEKVFRFVREDVASDGKTALDLANAIHGLGNIKQMRGEFESAIDNYKQATSIRPDHCYAWHDMFLCYYELARTGAPDLGAMRVALERTRSTGQGKPGLGVAHIARMEAMLHALEPDAIPSQTKPSTPAQGAAQGPEVRVIPEMLTLVIAESEPCVALFNLDCTLVNEGSDDVTVERLRAVVTTPDGARLPCDWVLFYASHPTTDLRMVKVGDAQPIRLHGQQRESMGIQFRGPAVGADQLWVAGDYEFECSGRILAPGGSLHANISTRFTAVVTDHNRNQVRHWAQATEAQWDGLPDPDRAAGVSVEVDNDSMTFGHVPASEQL